ncbi:MAG: DUF2149 domain-containing protein [Acidobacteriota bacterium]
MRNRRRSWEHLLDEDPAAGLLNLFDVWIAFAVALLLALVGFMDVPELMDAKSNITVIKDPGGANMEIIQKQGYKVDHFRATSDKLQGEGQRLGTAYRLASGEVVYVPESGPLKTVK